MGIAFKAMMKISYPLFILLLLISSCTKEIDLDFPDTAPQIALNGILHPDSLISITLTETLPVKDLQDFPVITDATVRLYEDDRLLGNLEYQDSAYTIDYHPKEGRQYRIEADVPNYPMVSASDIVPYPLAAEACFIDEKYSFSSYVCIRTSIQDHPLEANYYWLDIAVTDYVRRHCEVVDSIVVCLGYDSSRTYTERMFYIDSYSTIPDKFNAFVDNTLGGVTAYEGFIRIDDMAIGGESIGLDISAMSDPMFQYDEIAHLDSNQFVLLQVTSASQHYDRYLKSSWIYALNHDFRDTPNLFTEHVKIYSNVQNGTGIFAAYNSVSIDVENYPCE